MNDFLLFYIIPLLVHIVISFFAYKSGRFWIGDVQMTLGIGLVPCLNVVFGIFLLGICIVSGIIILFDIIIGR